MTKEEAIECFTKKYNCKWNEDIKGAWTYYNECLVIFEVKDKDYYICGGDIETGCINLKSDFLEDLINIIHLYYLGGSND